MINLKGKNIILAVCGGIAVYKVCDLVRKLISADAMVTCVMTENAMKFVTPLTFQTLSKNKVYHDMFNTESWDIDHISLAKKADIVVVVPATANTIAKLAYGFADNLVCSTVLATKAKILVCPAMNTNMLEHQATQKNIMTLKDYGYKFVEPKSGKLACGTVGNGNLASVENIVETIIKEII
ncbi:MAG: bifunctional phosphopantothenoylcysteine decarboxylase/phosphopantothenate--cysteine ligase CoaBC [Endomicrobiaceae bacterium]|nr:bifunctional phosphopantothenoylcysteine decarboxylase/phosphopantothenate--cysteine ligase CoaBC [Endomicrobiaceae bacterium]